MKGIELKKQDKSITILHVLGMAMILLCHIFQETGFFTLGEIFITGVPLFLFVAGYLSGKKKITNNLLWIGKRTVRLLLPYYILIISLFCIYEATKLADVSLFQWVFCLVNLQGLNYTVWKFDSYGAVAGIGPLWFLTTMMFAYFLTLILNKFRDVNLNKWQRIILILIVLLLQFAGVCIGIQPNYLIVYALGYFTGVKGVRRDGKYYLIISAIMVIATVIRFGLRSIVDGANFYDRYYALISSNAIAIWIFYTIFYFESKLPRIYAIAGKRWFLFIEAISFYVYLVHYLFLRSPFAPINYVNGFVVSTLLMLIFTFILSVALWALTEKVIIKYIFRKRQRRNAVDENISGTSR